MALPAGCGELNSLAESRNLIEVDGLVKSYGPVKALQGISFSVGEGEVLGFLGPNGAGKSTTLRILAGFMPGDSGRVSVNGFDVGEDSLAVRNSIGYLPEGVPIYPDMRVGEYLGFRARLKGISRADRKGRIGAALEETQTVDVAVRMIGTLSRGYRQRIGLADALLGEPPVLILDEPTVGLDPEQVRQFRSLLQEVGRSRTVILSTHILSEVELVCSSVAIISGGRLVAGDTVENLKGSLADRVCVVAEVNGPHEAVSAAFEALPGVSRVESDRPEGAGDDPGADYCRYRVFFNDAGEGAETIFDAVSSGGWRLRQLAVEELSLEDVFLDIVGGEE